jgi:hypothetical protein
MATFRTKQFVKMSFIIKAYSEEPNANLAELNDFVDHLVLRFAYDNKLFDEQLFRGGCGRHIKQDCIIIETGTKTNNVKNRMYNGRYI